MKTALISEDLYPYVSTKNVAVRICRDNRWFIGKLHYADLSNETLLIRLFALQEFVLPDGMDNSTCIVPEHLNEWKRKFWHDSPTFQPFNNPTRETDESSYPSIKITCDDSVIMLSVKEDDVLAVEKLLGSLDRGSAF
jgi:hypothetical protein